MQDHEASQLLDLLAQYMQDHGPAVGGSGPRDMTVKDLANDLRLSMCGSVARSKDRGWSAALGVLDGQ